MLHVTTHPSLGHVKVHFYKVRHGLKLLVGADRTDLCPAGRPHPLAGHRHQLAVDPDPEIAAQLDGARAKRPGPGTLDEIEHRRHVGRAEHDGIGVRFVGQVVPGQLESLYPPQRCPVGRRTARRVDEDELSSGPGQRGEVGPA